MNGQFEVNHIHTIRQHLQAENEKSLYNVHVERPFENSPKTIQ